MKRKFYAQYGRYTKVRDASWNVLLDFNITSLPIDVIGLANKLDIDVIKDSDIKFLTPHQSGIAVLSDDKRAIVYDDNMSYESIRFTIAHELGHIVLGHTLTKDMCSCVVFDEDKPEIEKSADMFAINLLAPACVLWGLDVQSSSEVSELCKISPESATYRFEKFLKLKKRKKFLTSPLEEKVYEQFEEFINNKLCEN